MMFHNCGWRIMNQQDVLNLIYKHGPLNRREMSELSGSNYNTLGGVLKRLLDYGLILKVTVPGERSTRFTLAARPMPNIRRMLQLVESIAHAKRYRAGERMFIEAEFSEQARALISHD